MEIRVFEINDNIKEETLEKLDKDNIKKIFDKIFQSKNMEHLKISCYANDDSIIREYNTNRETFKLKLLAEKLQAAENKKDGTRNKQITEGYLFVKHEKHRLFLLKLENIEVVDKEKNYEMRNSFSIEADYYKGCIFKNNIKDITIIDKNKSIAKYWREDFLSLSLNRDEYTNSTELIELLSGDDLFSNDIKQQSNFNDIKNRTENFIFENDTFDKTNLGNLLRTKKLITQTDLKDIYSEKSKVLDTEFTLSKKAVKEKYKKTIRISEDTKICTDNYAKLFRRQGIKYEDGNIILPVDDELISELPKELTNND
ncbi:hypothetical protein [Listeria booriae]|uniref:hypothetical protein n=1 Tax=Listeria booriae TaxID=1552123 RepID=UPI00164DF94B|nr:hypothetical protein [Listeria booriae]MBC6299442.1 hypothetical protein [Listeria booriae]